MENYKFILLFLEIIDDRNFQKKARDKILAPIIKVEFQLDSLGYLQRFPAF